MTRLLGFSLALFVLAACPAPVEPEPADGGADAGAPDASVPPDAGPADGGPGDGGVLSCDEAVYDAVLGTAQLGAAYRVVDSAVLPVTSWLPVAAVDEALPGGGAGIVIYGYAGDGRVHRLGVWPQLAAPDSSNVVFDAVSAEDRALQVLTTPLLATARGELLAGYRTLRSGGFVDGGLSLYDTARPDAGTRWLAAPGIEGALGMGSFFLVGGDGLGGVNGARGVYGIELGLAALTPQQVATYPVVANDVVRPGLMTITSNGVLALGYYVDGTNRHSVRLPEPARIADALSGGPAVELGAAQELTSADDVANLVSFGHGLAVLHTRKVRGALPAVDRLLHYPVSRVGGGDAGTVIGAPITLLSANDEGCTAVSQLVPVSGGLSVIVGLWDENGQRLVRLAAK